MSRIVLLTMKQWWLFKVSFPRTVPSFLFFFLVLLGVPYAIGSENLFDSIGKEVNRIFESNKSAVVRIRIEKRGGVDGYCSGFFIDPKGIVITASAGQAAEALFYVEYRNQWHLAKTVGVDERSGVVVLQVSDDQKPFPYLKLAKTLDVAPGMPVIGIGFPYNLPSSPSFGLIAGKECEYLNHFFPTTHLRINARINPGQVGGPLINSRGLAIGMITMSIKEEEWSYALPSNAIKKVVDDLCQFGKVRYGWVGVAVTKLGKEDAEGKVVVARLFPNTPVVGSGLREGDVVVSINGKKIENLSDVMDASFFVSVGQKIPVKVIRDGKPLLFEFLVGDRPLDAPSGSTILPSSPEELKKAWTNPLPVSTAPLSPPIEKTNGSR
ncbi:Serine protease Do (heat-shock protein) [Methylacidiphilum infernorum V4]|uniref:Serine protease Do (Heat-shock protein) n=2 Tax=Candidatus Methylacidiphilum infernorum TaxID=511746 RepID=B3DXV6_METI4|nr:Serine protease Do (heat-shock protein) [Methylacidiphilum infernorum V4]